MHRDLTIPSGVDVLIHAGDFTTHGNTDHADDLNQWFGELKRSLGIQHVIVVYGNHEHRSEAKTEYNPFASRIHRVLSNATFLQDESKTLQVQLNDKTTVAFNVHGTDFYWSTTVPRSEYANIPFNTHVLVAHNPPHNTVDGRKGRKGRKIENVGCPALRRRVDALSKGGHLKLVVSGHVHSAHGKWTDGKVTVWNAANCDDEDGHHGKIGFFAEMFTL